MKAVQLFVEGFLSRYYNQNFNDSKLIQMGLQTLNKDSLKQYFTKFQQHYFRTKKLRMKWDTNQVTYFMNLIEQYRFALGKAGLSDQDWAILAQCLPGKSEQQCKFKYLALNNVRVYRKWKAFQILILSKLVKESEGKLNWIQISRKLYQLNNDPCKIYRSNQLCKAYYNLYLKQGKKAKDNLEQYHNFIEVKFLNCCALGGIQ